MTSELVVDVQPKEVSIALLEDKQLVELQSEGQNVSFSVGNMYLGRVKKLMPGLNACFVDVGYEKDAFLHYLDLGPQFNSLEKFVKQTLSDRKKLTNISKASILPDLEKDGTIANTLKVGQEVVVQIVKEPISTKGPRLTSELSFAGRYLVLIPFNDKVSVSQKIKSSEERARLKQLLMSIKPKNFGVIVRTVAEGKRVAELDGELKVLLKHWEEAMVKVQKVTKYPTLIYEETSRRPAARSLQPLLREHSRQQRNRIPRNQGLRNPYSPRTRGHCEALQRRSTHLRQFRYHQADQGLVWTHRFL